MATNYKITLKLTENERRALDFALYKRITEIKDLLNTLEELKNGKFIEIYEEELKAVEKVYKIIEEIPF